MIKDFRMWRWWDGSNWSVCVDNSRTAIEASQYADHNIFWTQNIQWNDYWPKFARVPRIDPSIEMKEQQ